ncbi:TetR/AcrR family transcriptional regulator [Sinirhodobacter sp. WL0062]|uniref:TetR/AcrR family transcriptional regulator n=1 Tax=Rhodobacter flavimaris TaxID=2907145 RepID=A0ABS8YZM5_9RHOB|nr:TetR/AcrR family transcriptional regulator [Sinirhodobacter sp. WL0062]MCE5975118.1 TetR/AcrR family transcriptional regulator [Sinirhodobacter sp. WL0062]
MSSAAPLSRPRGRPRKSVEEMAHLHDALIRAGLVVLTEKGFSAVGIDEILRLAGVPKGSFYAYYDSKEAFGRALITAYAGYFAEKLDRWFLDETLPPLARLSAFIEDAKAGMARHGFTRGCLVGNLGQEMGTLPPSFRTQLTEVLLDWQARTAICLRAAQAAGEIGPKADCDQLAAIFWIGWEGAVLRAKLELSPTPLDTFAAGFLAMLR